MNHLIAIGPGDFGLGGVGAAFDIPTRALERLFNPPNQIPDVVFGLAYTSDEEIMLQQFK